MSDHEDRTRIKLRKRYREQPIEGKRCCPGAQSDVGLRRDGGDWMTSRRRKAAALTVGTLVTALGAQAANGAAAGKRQPVGKLKRALQQTSAAAAAQAKYLDGVIDDADYRYRSFAESLGDYRYSVQRVEKAANKRLKAVAKFGVSRRADIGDYRYATSDYRRVLGDYRYVNDDLLDRGVHDSTAASQFADDVQDAVGDYRDRIGDGDYRYSSGDYRHRPRAGDALQDLADETQGFVDDYQFNADQSAPEN